VDDDRDDPSIIEQPGGAGWGSNDPRPVEVGQLMIPACDQQLETRPTTPPIVVLVDGANRVVDPAPRRAGEA
jgi:hypothetical protein